jgi:hypothetical protein
MRTALAAIFAFVAVFAISQDRVTIVVPSKGPRWQKGVVEGRSYKNPILGIELSPPPGFDFGTPELKGDPGTVPLLVTINALGPATLFSSRDVLSFYSDALAYYPANRRTTDDYVRRVVLGNERRDSRHYRAPLKTKLAGRRLQDRIFRGVLSTKLCSSRHAKPRRWYLYSRVLTETRSIGSSRGRN